MVVAYLARYNVLCWTQQTGFGLDGGLVGSYNISSLGLLTDMFQLKCIGMKCNCVLYA
jgi:hypothetical protein